MLDVEEALLTNEEWDEISQMVWEYIYDNFDTQDREVTSIFLGSAIRTYIAHMDKDNLHLLETLFTMKMEHIPLVETYIEFFKMLKRVRMAHIPAEYDENITLIKFVRSEVINFLRPELSGKDKFLTAAMNGAEFILLSRSSFAVSLITIINNTAPNWFRSQLKMRIGKCIEEWKKMNSLPYILTKTEVLVHLILVDKK